MKLLLPEFRLGEPVRYHLPQEDKDWEARQLTNLERLADTLKEKILIIHPPRKSDMSETEAIAAMTVIVGQARHLGFRALFENLTGSFYSDPEWLLGNEFDICYDIGHHVLQLIRRNLKDRVSKEERIRRAVEGVKEFVHKYRDRIDYVHVHSPSWLKDTHVEPSHPSALISERQMMEILGLMKPDVKLVTLMFDSPWYKEGSNLIVRLGPLSVEGIT